MKPIPDCVPDALNMIIATARAVSDDDFIHRKILLKVMGEIAEDGDLGSNPADLYLQCWETACRSLGVKDPFENEKARNDKTALGLVRFLAECFPPKPDDDPLRTAIRVSFAGAMVDFTGLGRSDIQETVAEYYRRGPALDESEDLIAALDKAQTVMLVAHRAGGIATDKPMLDVLASRGKKVYLSVSPKPIFYMATAKDVETCGYSDAIEVIDPGTAMYGLDQERASSEYQELFEKTDVVMVKGTTHLDTISPVRDLYFILKATEDEVALRLGIEKNGGAIVKAPASL